MSQMTMKSYITRGQAKNEGDKKGPLDKYMNK